MKEQTMTVFLFIFSVDTAQCSFYLHSYHWIVADWVGPSQGSWQRNFMSAIARQSLLLMNRVFREGRRFCQCNEGAQGVKKWQGPLFEGG